MPKYIAKLRDKQWLADIYKTHTQREIADMIGCSKDGVRHAMARYGIRPRDSGRPRIAQLHDDDWITREYATKPTREIARMLGCSQPAVLNAVQRLDLPRHTPRTCPDGPKGGYRTIKVPGRKHAMLLHRYLMEQYLGRHIEPHEVVHHIDGNSLNNALGNLIVLTKRAHDRVHSKRLYEDMKARGWKSYQRKCVVCGHSFIGGNRAKYCNKCHPRKPKQSCH